MCARLIFSANIALKHSTRPPFNSYFQAPQEKWAIEHITATFRTVQALKGRQTPRASKSHILRFFSHFYGFANYTYLVSAYFIKYYLIIYLLGIPFDKILFWWVKRSTDWKSASSWRLHVAPLPVYCYQCFLPFFSQFCRSAHFGLHSTTIKKWFWWQ